MFGTRVLKKDPCLYDAITNKIMWSVGVDHVSMLSAEHLEAIVQAFKEIVVVPSDVFEQLTMAINNIYDEWGIAIALHDKLGPFGSAEHQGTMSQSHSSASVETVPSSSYSDKDVPVHSNCKHAFPAVVVQAMVHGNRSSLGGSGSGIMFTRSPVSGENVLTGMFLPNSEAANEVLQAAVAVTDRQQETAFALAPTAAAACIPIAKMQIEYVNTLMDLEQAARSLEYLYQDIQVE
jgi:hypothetical protein